MIVDIVLFVVDDIWLLLRYFFRVQRFIGQVMSSVVPIAFFFYLDRMHSVAMAFIRKDANEKSLK